jgi:GTP-sensing transcriptional pleiotropic repressor CodY
MNLLQQFRDLTDVLRSHYGETDVTPVVAQLSQALDATVFLTDARGRETARVTKEVAEGGSSRRGRTAVVELVAELPVYTGRQLVGTLNIERTKPLNEDDQVLAEYAATILGILLDTGRHGQEAEADRRSASVRIALDALSYSEQAAAKRLFEALNGPQGLVVTSHIADEMGITRSVIVNALRKLESAGVIETRSLGMKGTFIRVLNPLLPEAFRELRL